MQPFILTRYPPPRKAYPDRERSRRLSSLTIRRQEGVSGPRVVQPSIFTRYPPPGGRFRAANGLAVYSHLISAARMAYSEPEGSSRLSSLAIHRREGVSGPRVVQPFIFTRHPPPGRRTGGPRVVRSSIFARYPPPERSVRTLSGPGVHLHSPSTAVKAFPDRERSSRSYSLAIRRQEGVSGSRMVQPFIFFRYPLSATRKAYPNSEWSIFTRHPPPGGRFRATNGPALYPHSISATRKGCPGPEGSRRVSSLVIHRREGVCGPRVVQSSIFGRYPPPERPVRTLSGPGVHLYSPSTAVKAFPDRQWCCRSSSLAFRCQEGVSVPRGVQTFTFSAIRRHGSGYGPPGASCSS